MNLRYAFVLVAATVLVACGSTGGPTIDAGTDAPVDTDACVPLTHAEACVGQCKVKVSDNCGGLIFCDCTDGATPPCGGIGCVDGNADCVSGNTSMACGTDGGPCVDCGLAACVNAVCLN